MLYKLKTKNLCKLQLVQTTCAGCLVHICNMHPNIRRTFITCTSYILSSKYYKVNIYSIFINDNKYKLYFSDEKTHSVDLYVFIIFLQYSFHFNIHVYVYVYFKVGVTLT